MNCPLCGSIAYVGLNLVDCPNKGCKYYHPNTGYHPHYGEVNVDYDNDPDKHQYIVRFQVSTKGSSILPDAPRIVEFKYNLGIYCDEEPCTMLLLEDSTSDYTLTAPNIVSDVNPGDWYWIIWDYGEDGFIYPDSSGFVLMPDIEASVTGVQVHSLA